VKVVIYGVKSSLDEKESVADQHRIVREAIGDDERIIGAYGEANQSGFRSERGPQLEAAMRTAIQAAAEDGEAELWVWHSSRLARGDGTKGKRSIALIVAQLLYENVTVRSATDPEMVTPMLAGIASTVSNKYAEDLSTWTRRGLARRKAQGKPVGPVPFGFKVERTVDGAQVRSERVVDPVTAPAAHDAHVRVAGGETTGDVARRLNAAAHRTIYGKPWNPDAVRWMIENASYEGRNGYPQIVEPELAERAREALKRTDPAAVQRRKGGRPPKDPAFLLRGIAHCLGCGAPLYCLGRRGGRPRRYICRNVKQANGICDRPPIVAQAAEGHALGHLDWFIGDLENWARGQLAAQSGDRAAIERDLDAKRAELAALDGRREQRMAELEQVGFNPIALEVIERIDRDRAATSSLVADAEAQLAEWTAQPALDALLDFYNGLRDVIAGRVKQAQGARELNTALADVLAGVWLGIDGGLLKAEFELRRRPDTDDLLVSWLPVGVRMPTWGNKDQCSHTSTRWWPSGSACYSSASGRAPALWPGCS
jgi:DNA invertase Pin-like site-specific DNA recombinase